VGITVHYDPSNYSIYFSIYEAYDTNNNYSWFISIPKITYIGLRSGYIYTWTPNDGSEAVTYDKTTITTN
jgi:hypothetical protein